MPVIAVASPKGGCGKTTTSLILATTLADMGASVTALDCDRNRPLAKWRSGQSASSVEVAIETNEANIIDRIDDYRTRRQFVIIDLEGAGSLLMSRAIGRAQFVVIPLQPSDLDADEAAKAIGLVRAEEKVFGRKIDHRVVFTRTSPAIKTRIEKDIMRELEEGGVPTFVTQINERQPYKAMFRYRKALSEMDPALIEREKIDRAQENARQFVSELITFLAPQQAAA